MAFVAWILSVSHDDDDDNGDDDDDDDDNNDEGDDDDVSVWKHPPTSSMHASSLTVPNFRPSRHIYKKFQRWPHVAH